MNEQKRFDTTACVDCSTCEKYWQSSCDGVDVGTYAACKQYVATRAKDIETELKHLWFAIGCLAFGGICGGIGSLIHYFTS